LHRWLDDNFRTIVDAVAEGRQLFQNLRLAFAYLLLVHLPLVIGAAVIPLMGLSLLFLPIHIVWLELVIHPTAMLAFQDLPLAGPLAPVQRHSATDAHGSLRLAPGWRSSWSADL
jgi:Ca2+-transporting ATPase